jgi:hypothetical protein
MPTLGRTELHNEGRVKKHQPTPVRITAAAAAGTVLTVTFDQPVVLKGTPNWTTDVVGATAVSAVSPSIDTVAITFSASIAAATEINIASPVDPAIRSKDGGYVADSYFKV